jgi:aminoglycoside phosphotransferase (APT) family kinase protein
MQVAAPSLSDDRLLGDVLVRLDPAHILELAQAELPNLADGPCHAVPLDTLYHPGRYVRRAFAFLRDPHTPANRVWPEGEILYVHAPARSPMSRRGRVHRLGDTEVEVYRFPNDRRLRGLRRFAGVQLAPRVWQQWLDAAAPGARLDPATLQRRFIRYCPEYKWIVRLRAEVKLPGAGETVKRRIAVRCAAPRACADLAERHAAVTRALAGASLRVPALVGVRDDLGLVAVEWERGEPFIAHLKGNDLALKTFVDALAAFHGAAVPGLPSLTSDDLATSSRAAAEEMALVVPEAADDLRDVTAELGRRLHAFDVPAAKVLHNDLHVRQLHVRRGRMTFLDLERMALGDPLIDVANFAVQLAVLPHRPEFQVERPQADRWVAAFLAAWAARAGQSVDPRRFQPYCAAAFLKLAHGRMRHLRPAWREAIRHGVESAARQLSGSASLEALP